MTSPNRTLRHNIFDFSKILSVNGKKKKKSTSRYTSSNRIMRKDDVALPLFFPYPGKGWRNTLGLAVVRMEGYETRDSPLMERQSTAVVLCSDSQSRN